jgi:hypothetical protein
MGKEVEAKEENKDYIQEHEEDEREMQKEEKMFRQ